MADSHKLARAQVDRGLEVLELELLNIRISRRQMILYRFYLGSFALLLLAGMGMVFFSPPVDDQGLVGEQGGPASAAFTALTTVTGLAFYATIISFLFNIGLIRKLWRIAKVRRRLGLTQPLESAFSERRRRGWIVNSVTGFFVLMGAVTIVLPALLIFTSGVSWSVILTTAPLFLLGGAALLSVHFLRRGMERFKIVQDLHTELKAETGPGDAMPPLDDASYDILAHLERFQIMEQRQQSIARASADRDTFGYALQMSFEAQESKDGFPDEERQLIDRKILELISDPESVGEQSTRLPEGDFLKVGVEGSDVAIQYRVDKSNHRVQVARIASSERKAGAS